MKLYMHPVSTTSRPVMQFIADNDIKCDMEVVDILKGAHYEPAYSKINPNHLIPMLEDGDFRLTESAAILRYLAEKIDSPAYPKDIKQRARVNEVMDWFNSNFYRDWGYGLIYPQLFPHLKREDAKVQEAVVAYGKEKSKIWLQILNDHFIGPNNRTCAVTSSRSRTISAPPSPRRASLSIAISRPIPTSSAGSTPSRPGRTTPRSTKPSTASAPRPRGSPGRRSPD
jgi:glutathione S-transferase